MTTKNTTEMSIKEYILSVVKNDKPETADQLIRIVRQKYTIPEREITNLVTQLQNEGKIHFTEKEMAPQTLNEFIFSSKAVWFWITIMFAVATTITVFTIAEDAYPIVYVRYVLGFILVLWLPGYALIKALFPVKREMNNIERIALSFCISLALVPIVGLILNYTPWGVRLAPITLSFLALTVTFALAAMLREYQARTNRLRTSE